MAVAGDDIKPCPRCQVLIAKMDDGSCNHMTCALCGSEFCWLCMKEISDLHYLSPSGCTFWGKKPWSRKKKILWQLGTLVGAPVGIALLAGIAAPAMIIGIPIWVGRKLFARYKTASKHKRNLIVTSGVAASVSLFKSLQSFPSVCQCCRVYFSPVFLENFWIQRRRRIGARDSDTERVTKSISLNENNSETNDGAQEVIVSGKLERLKRFCRC